VVPSSTMLLDVTNEDGHTYRGFESRPLRQHIISNNDKEWSKEFHQSVKGKRVGFEQGVLKRVYPIHGMP